MEVLQKFKQRKFYTYRVSCLLSCLLLVLLSGFLSVSADVLPISSVPVSADSAYFHFSGSDKVVFSTGITDYTYRFTTDTSSSNGFCRFAFNNNSYFSYPFNFSSFDYYLAVSV